eukprot:gene23787-26920_t
MFPQYGRTQFGLSGYATGVLFSLSGALSAVTNVYLLQWTLASSHRPEIYLWLYLLITALGLYVWALWSSLHGLIVAMVVVTVSSNLFQGILQNTIMKCMKELREGNNNLDAECTLSNGDDVEEGYQVEQVDSNTLAHSFESMEAGSPCSVAYPHLRTRTKHATAHHNHHNINNHQSHHSNNRSSKSANAGAGAVFGLSASADRAARVVSPMLGGVLIHHFNTTGLVVLITASVSYGLVLLFHSKSISCVSMTSLIQDGSDYGTKCMLHASSMANKVLQSLQSVHVKRGLDAEMLYYGGEKNKHEKYL